MINAKLKKVFKSTVSLMLVLGLMATTAACGKDTTKEPNKPNDGGQTDVGASYTYNDLMSSAPKVWNPHEWELTCEGDMLTYSTIGLYDFAFNEARDGYIMVPEMAASAPVDVTSEYAGDERFNVPADATKEYAYKVTLNPDARWENGEQINADTYIYSMQQILNYQMKNYRASGQYGDSVAIANGEKYYKQQQKIYTPIKDAEGYRDVEDKDMLFSMTEAVVFFDNGAAKKYYGSNKDCFITEDGTDLYEKYSEKAYYELTDEAKAELTKIAVAFGDNNPEAYKEFCVTFDGTSDPFPWENVGFLKTGEYEITYVVDKPVTPFYFQYGTSSLPLVYEKLYEECKKQTGDIIKSTYGTSAETYISYGPYKLVEYQNDKVAKFEKNTEWYGYTDGKHEGQFQATAVNVSIIKEQPTQLQLFLQGKLDGVGLVATDMDKYRSSEYLKFTPQTYTSKMTMNSDKAALKSRESEGINKSILSYIDFRHAISLSLNREEFVTQCTACHVAGFGIINNLYIYDPENSLNYRGSEQAKKVLTDLYGVDSIEDITGYDKATATKLFTKAYNEALAAGDIKDTDKIQLEYLVYSASETSTKMINFIQGSIDAATVGTPLEGKVEILMTADEDYYDHSQTGAFEFIFSTWGGATLRPFGMMECYCKTEKRFEYGFVPEEVELTLTIDGEESTMTYSEWEYELNNGKYCTAPNDTKLQILAGIESGLLNQYICPPLYYRVATSLKSMKVEDGTDTYVALMAFGGIRYKTFNYTDEEWDKYCKDHNNQLQY